MAVLPGIRINRHATIRRETISEDQHCVIVDNFLHDPYALIEFAAQHNGEFAVPDRGYPGLLFDVNKDAMTDICGFIRSQMTKHFSFFKGGMNLSSYLSMVTMKPDELSNLQRLCHSDPRTQPGYSNYAALVYLFENEELGGTGFYRWKDRKLMQRAAAIEREDSSKGLAFLEKNFPTYRKPPCYMTASNEIAEHLCTIPARFNRLVFYCGDVPHSGAITAPDQLSNDFRKGRLTLNCFASVVPK